MGMLAFVNHYASALRLPVRVPIKDQQIQRLLVASPVHNRIRLSYGGNIRASNYLFSFNYLHWSNPGSYLHDYSGFSITKLEDDGFASFGIPMQHQNESSASLMERASKMTYSVTTNDLYRIATNYMLALEMDQNNFTHKLLTVEQGGFHSDRGMVPGPLVYVYWGNPELRNPGPDGFAFEVSAVSGELLELNAGDATGCKELHLVKELDKLLAISDEEFQKYSTLDRSNLLVQFADLHCTNMYCPGIDEPLTLQTKTVSQISNTNTASSTPVNAK